jgi:capsular exopolysaccharide synthesis family protein
MALDHPLRSLLVTSPGPLEGKSLTACGLAVSMALAGRKVILADADLHRPVLHRRLGLRHGPGLTDALLNEQLVLAELLQETSIAGLRFLGGGDVPSNPGELLTSPRMHDVLAQLRAMSDMVVIDTPPAAVLVDASILSPEVDGVLLVAKAGRTRREMARRALISLNRVGALVVGAVLNGMPKSGVGYYYYTQANKHYYYMRHDGHDSKPGANGSAGGSGANGSGGSPASDGANSGGVPEGTRPQPA